MTNLLKFAIERTFRGIDPAPTITAPHPDQPMLTMLTERERLDQFEQSRNTRDGEVAPYRRAA